MEALTRHETHINIEMSGDTKFYMVSAKQGDKATRYVIAKLLNDGKEYTIPSGARAVVNIKKPDGKHVYNTCTYSGATVTVELTNQALAAAGTAYCDIEIRAADNTQVITSASFTIEIEESMRDDDAILSANEFTELEEKVGEHIKDLDGTNEAVKKAEAARVEAEAARVEAEKLRQQNELLREQNELIRQQQEQSRQEDTSQAVKNVETATKEAQDATKDCKAITERAEKALQNQEQLEATLNEAVALRQEVSQMHDAVEKAKDEVEQDKAEIEETIKNSLLAESEKILDSVKKYLERAEALYSSMYLDCDGENPYLRSVTTIFIDGATPQVRNVNEGVDFDGGTPMSRLLAA